MTIPSSVPRVSFEPGSFHVSPSQRPGIGMAILEVMHVCEHPARYAYGGPEFAQNDGPRMAAKTCLHCHSRSELERYARERGETYKPLLGQRAH